ncbi:MAG TPA: outer membrane lipoprotein-sorting protein [Phycisphaerae bacterium]|nr:outer membrane lipoprotein-sorting protein [Phycisphaerae bacterium]HOJ74871.1 outer membrane lipoprotein-sorting protein [Phycisphaerae bacterium]HOM52034.1 outer membrane lipoprotein-sorting protein [Phycisphaerae bacterium]HON64920.1 outer membrane lipoprotein-sorting protein [Phycisphaerae bacterium]HPP27342.1 outer membrane lipoprotein-sorting protein [Phycisphaerae bacterium]
MRQTAQITSLFVLLGLSSAAFAETLEEVERKIAERVAAHKTLQMEQKTTSRLTIGDAEVVTEAQSQVHIVRRPENKWVSRTETKSRTIRKIEGQPEEKQDIKMLAICDGKHTYLLSESPQFTSAMKQKVDEKTLNPLDLEALFKLQRQQYDLKLLPGEKVDGVDCYVIESTPKKEEGVSELLEVSRVVSWYDKKTGLSVKGEVYGKDGKVTTTTRTLGVKIDEPIADEQFVFKAPPGVTVIDMDAVQAGGESQDQASGTAAGASPSDESAPAGSSADKPADPPPGQASTESKDSGEKKKEDPAGKAVKGLLKGFGR